MKKAKLLLFSVSPLIIVYLLHYTIYNFDWYGRILSIISILFCVYWYYVGYKSYDYAKTIKESLLLGNCFAIVSIVLILFQLLVLKRFSFSIIGLALQMFFLPMVRASSWVENIILFFTPFRISEVNFVISFILMMGIYYAGYKKIYNREKRI